MSVQGQKGQKPCVQVSLKQNKFIPPGGFIFQWNFLQQLQHIVSGVLQNFHFVYIALDCSSETCQIGFDDQLL